MSKLTFNVDNVGSFNVIDFFSNLSIERFVMSLVGEPAAAAVRRCGITSLLCWSVFHTVYSETCPG